MPPDMESVFWVPNKNKIILFDVENYTHKNLEFVNKNMDWRTSILCYHSLGFITDLLSKSVNGKPPNNEIIVVRLSTINICCRIIF